MARSSVDFPQPDGPTSAMNSPSPISRETSSIATTSPANTFVMSRSSISAMAAVWIPHFRQIGIDHHRGGSVDSRDGRGRARSPRREATPAARLRSRGDPRARRADERSGREVPAAVRAAAPAIARADRRASRTAQRGRSARLRRSRARRARSPRSTRRSASRRSRPRAMRSSRSSQAARLGRARPGGGRGRPRGRRGRRCSPSRRLRPTPSSGSAPSGATPYVVGALDAAAEVRRAHRLRRLGAGSPLASIVGARDPRRRRPRVPRGLDPAESRNGAEARAQHDLDRLDDPARQDVRQPHGRRRRREREARGPRAHGSSRQPPARRPPTSTTRSPMPAATPGSPSCRCSHDVDAETARQRLDAAGRSIAAALEDDV